MTSLSVVNFNMNKKTAISDSADIRNLVDEFYKKVDQDELIGPVFNMVLSGKWADHLEKMYAFWETVLLEKSTYKGTPFLPHSGLGLKAIHFTRWLELWSDTLEKHYEGTLAEEAKWRAEKMGLMFQAKLDYYSRNQAKPLL